MIYPDRRDRSCGSYRFLGGNARLFVTRMRSLSVGDVPFARGDVKMARRKTGEWRGDALEGNQVLEVCSADPA